LTASTPQDYLQHLRRVGFVDPETGKRLIFFEQLFCPALTVTALYKQCWQGELFSKWIKQIYAPAISLERPRTR
jgi:hypothetical protein